MDNSGMIELTDSEFNQHVDQKVSRERITAMVRKMNHVEEKIGHLQKVRDRWSLATDVIKGSSVTLTFLLTFFMTILNVLPVGSIDPVALKIATAAMSSLVTLTALTAEGTVLGFTNKNMNKFQKQVTALQKKYNRCYLYYEAARADKVITNDELNGFYRIFDSDEEMSKGEV